jgi:hypothetical protein
MVVYMYDAINVAYVMSKIYYQLNSIMKPKSTQSTNINIIKNISKHSLRATSLLATILYHSQILNFACRLNLVALESILNNVAYLSSKLANKINF